jgi:hypothetical protein
MDDVDTRYEISYRPAYTRLDGKFHEIDVKLARPDLHADTRDGYYAVPDEDSLTAADVAGLRALNSQPLPHSFDFNSKAFWFRQPGGDDQYSIVFDVPVSHLTAKPEPDLKRHAFHAILFAVTKDSHGEIVSRFSKDVPSEVSDDYLAKLQAESVTFEHPVTLPPDSRSVDAVVVDREGNRSSVNTLQVPPRCEAPSR